MTQRFNLWENIWERWRGHWRSDDVSASTNSDLKRRNRWSCFLMARDCFRLNRLCRKIRFATDTFSYPTSTFKELYNKLLIIKSVLKLFLCKLRIKGINFDLKSFKIQHAFLPCILRAAPTIYLNLMKRIIFGKVHITDLLTKQFPETHCNFKAPSTFFSTSYCFLPYIRCIMLL
jgi:hypothetical protein